MRGLLKKLTPPTRHPNTIIITIDVGYDVMLVIIGCLLTVIVRFYGREIKCDVLQTPLCVDR